MNRPPLRRLLVALLPALALSSIASTAFAQSADMGLAAAIQSGNWGTALAVIFGVGLLSSLTPCVYPMIAITVSVFGAAEAKSKLHAAMLSTMYVAGLVVFFTVLGLVVGLTGTVNGTIMGSPWVMFPLAAFLIVMSASMFGAFEMNLPPALQNRIASMGGLGPRGAFVLGMVGGLVAMPCTGPVLGGLLAYIYTAQSVAFGATALATYALGLGALTWLVGTFAVGLPKSGRWLEWVKSFFGLVMIACALWFIRPWLFGIDEVVEKTTVWLLFAVGLLIGGLALGAVHLSFSYTSTSERFRKGLGVTMASVGAFLAVVWINAAPYLPPDARIAWNTDYEAARAQAMEEGRPLLVDFGADWCGACNELERDTFSDPRVIREGQRFIAVRIDMTAGEEMERGREILATYNQRGLPLVVMHGSDGEEIARVEEFVEADRMLELMHQVE
jgi:thiol:disulfide interchange protein DsbD